MTPTQHGSADARRLRECLPAHPDRAGSGLPVRVVLETEHDRILVGTGLLAGDITGSDWDLHMPGLPHLLRALANQHEDAITSGPPATWLEDDDHDDGE